MRWLAVMVALSGCRTLGPRPATGFAATHLAVDFPRPDEGFARFEVRLPAAAAQVRAVSWELFVSGRKVAAGLDSTATTSLEGAQVVVHLDLPLVFRHRAVREGPTFLKVLVRGEVQAGPGPERYGFFGRAEVLAHGAPELSEAVE